MSANFEITCSRGFPEWLAEQHISLGVTTYQGNRLLLLGLKPDGRLSVFQRIFQRCMGLHVVGCDSIATSLQLENCDSIATNQHSEDGSRQSRNLPQTLWMTSQCQIWRFENMLAEGQSFEGCDRSFAPQQSYYTGDVDAHDIAVEASGRVLFISTLLSCVATVNDRFSLEPVWKPPFVTKLAAEDRCHLNGMALEDGKLKYVTACAQTNSFDGWRDQRDSGGCVIDVESGEAVLTGLSMPHSPRVRDGRLWVLNSGHGQFVYSTDKPRASSPSPSARAMRAGCRSAAIGRSSVRRCRGTNRRFEDSRWSRLKPVSERGADCKSSHCHAARSRIGCGSKAISASCTTLSSCRE